MGFPEQLNAAIKQTGLKKKDFAARTDVSRAQLFNYLGGKSEPSLSFFQAVKREFPEIDMNRLIVTNYDKLLESAVQQHANGDGNIQVGGQFRVHGDIHGAFIGGGNSGEVKATIDSPSSYGKDAVRISRVVEVLEDYVAPKICKEIEEKLKK